MMLEVNLNINGDYDGKYKYILEFAFEFVKPDWFTPVREIYKGNFDPSI